MTDTRTITLENALKALGINPDNDPMHHAKRWIEGRDDDQRERDRMTTAHGDALARVQARDMRIADLERDLAAKDDAFKATQNVLIKIGEAINTPEPSNPDDVLRVFKAAQAESEHRMDALMAAEAIFREMIDALDRHGAPRRYDDPGTPGKRNATLPPAERLRVALSIQHWAADAATRRAHEAEESLCALREERRAACDALTALGAPSRADDFDLDLAARIRALPR